MSRRASTVFLRRGGIGAALAATGVLALAACGSSGGSSNTSTAGLGASTTASASQAASAGTGSPTATASGSATSGSIVWSASPLTGTGANDARTVLINAFEKQYPNILFSQVSATT